MICANTELSKLDLRFNQAYQALYQQLDGPGKRRLQDEDIEFLNSVQNACGVPPSGSMAGSAECVAAHYERKRSEWISRLSGPAHEEAVRPIEQHIALQAKLRQLGYLPATAKIDGVYSVATRAAISQWQTASGRPTTGFIGEADAAVFGAPEPSLAAGAAPAQSTAALPAIAIAPSATSTASSAVLSEGDEVRLKERGGTYVVPVRINDAITLDFVLDSGASDVLIPADVLLTLLRTETVSKSDFLGERTYVLADGSKLPSARVNLRELRVGGHRLMNVAASVGSPESHPLLGQSFLSRFKSWTLDNDRHLLVLDRTGRQPTQPISVPAVPSDHRSAPTGPYDSRNFDTFPVVAVYRGAMAMPDFEGRDRQFKDYRTRLRNGIAEGANFAGRYKVIQFGCGTGCSFVLVADVSTGQVYSFPHGGEYDQMLRLEYRISSSLIHAAWVPSLDHMDQCMQEDFLFSDGRFTSLSKPMSAPCPG